ncbi:OLC1v1034089C1 [Oldenlandia corymbosa var. corymbosa]|uniref:OLC1v1034089C1 n=1 Tax=Oldenlandia corymbosa var. corymbosa TaxID=529605 RepID=A0AAV1CSX1_OLDCO|nr:OLC1v1034089C1 [Oldenlandia corymbosa var. corymbosa]
MRAGGCTVQQSLTVEAANVVKQALALARRRGHAQVTPLHVANTMLSTSNGLLRTACLQSHSHPLQCKALELCFNVALNRLPASSSGPMLGHHHHSPSSQQHPTISNALVAAFKRAQAHQRRGSIENQQQPLLAVKIELEQLIISILDDPSVSRVMREAGFSSTQVKTNVEQAVSKETTSDNSNSVILSKPSLLPVNEGGSNSMKQSKPSCTTTTTTTSFDPVKDEDVEFVLESLMNKRRKSVVIVGECLSSLEGVVGGMMDKIEKRNVVEGLKEVKIIRVGLNTFSNLRREEVEQKVGELSCLVRSLVGNGVILYLGDLKWIVDYRASSSSSNDKQGRNSYYCPVEHMIMELGRLVYGLGGENGRLWLMGLATFQTFMRCKSGQHSLEALWGLHPITIPAGGLDLSLNTESANGSEIESRSKTAESSLPSWLKDESKRLKNNDINQSPLEDQLSQQKWNPIICSSSIQKPTISLDRNLTFSSSSSPSSSTSFFSYDHHHQHHHNVNIMPKQAISPLTTSTPNSATSSDDVMEMEYVSRFKEFNAENLNTLCNALEQKVPWQKDVIPDIAGTILQCRSGMLKRKEKVSRSFVDHDQQLVKEETWLFFQGLDVQAKEKIAKELAKVVFGSYSNFVTIALSSFSSSTRGDSSDLDHENNKLIGRCNSFKRLRDEQSCCSYIGRLAQEISSNPHRVFLVEDVEQADFHSQMGIKRAIERGKITHESSGEEVSLCDAIIILSCESFSSRSRACSPTTRQKLDIEEEGKGSNPPFVSLDLNISINDERVEEDEGQSIDDVGILENVDGRIVFKMHELSALVM